MFRIRIFKSSECVVLLLLRMCYLALKHVNKYNKSYKSGPRFIEHYSPIDKTWSRGVPGPFWVTDRAPNCPRVSNLDKNYSTKVDILDKKAFPKDAFSKIPTKIDRWRQGRYWGPLKIISGSGFETT